VRGLKYTEKENLQKNIKDFCSEVLLIEPELQIQTVRPLGISSGGSRPLLCTFLAQSDTMNILGKPSCLRGTGIFIDKDYPVGIRLKRNKLLMIRRELLKVNKGARVRLIQDNLYINNVKFRWDEREGLKPGEEDGLAKLRAVVSEDLSGLVKVLNGENEQEKRSHQP
jgi:hypothetical protein